MTWVLLVGSVVTALSTVSDGVQALIDLISTL